MALKITLLCFLLCGLFAVYQAKPNPQAESDLHVIVTNFARKIFKAVVAKSGHENIIMSPYAIQRIIMVTLQAARGQLYAEMQRALEIECIGDVLADGLFKNYPEGFHYCDQIFHSVSTTLRIPFILIAKILFNVSPETVDFATPKAVSKTINSFVEKSTTGMIKKMFTSAEIANDSSIYFINAVYFESHWQTPFDKSKDRLSSFLNNGNQDTKVLHMYGVQYVNYAELKDLDSKVVELPYKDANEKMLIVLPNNNARDDFKKIQERILKTDFHIILKRMKSTLVALSIPYFSIEYRTDLTELLPHLSMEGLLAPDVDLSNGFDQQPPSMKPRIYQKAFFDMNNHGSVVDVPHDKLKPSQFDDSKSPDNFFLVSNPFLFFLHTNGTVHFVGSVQSVNN